MTGAELQAKLENAVKDSTLALSPETLGSAAIDALIDAFFPDKTLNLGGAALSLAGDTVTLTGSLSLLSAQWTVSGAMTAGDSALTLVLTAKSPTGATVNLDSMVTEYLSISHPPSLPSLTVSSLTFHAGPSSGTYSLTAELSGDWKIAVGNTHLDLKAPGLTLAPGSGGGALTGEIGATATIAGAELVGKWELPKDFSLSGTLGKSVNLMPLVEDVAGSILPHPDHLATVSLSDVVITLSEEDGDYTFFAQAGAGDFGSVDVEVLSGPKAVAAFALPADWTLVDSTDLSPFAGLTLSGSRVVLSSFSDDDFAYPDGSLVSDVSGVSEGAEFLGTLSLSGGALGIVSKLLKRDSLQVRGVLGSEMALDAELSGGVQIIPGVALDDVSVGVKDASGTLSVDVSASTTVKVGGESLTFTESAAVTDDEATFSLSLGKPWVHPFGIGGLTIESVILSIGIGSTETVGIYGAIAFGSGDEVKVAAQFLDGEDPDFLLGELDGTLTLKQIIDACTGISMPSALNEVSISNFKLVVVDNPQGVTIGDLTFPAGFSFHGTIHFFGFTLTTAMSVSDTQVKASGTMSKLDFASVFELTDASGQTGPSMSLDTSGSPELKLSGRVVLLGLSESLYGEVSSDGFTFDLKSSLKSSIRIPGASASVDASYALSTTYKKEERLTAQGSVNFDFTASIGPIKMPTHPVLELGSIHLDTGFHGTISLSVASDFELSVSGSVKWDGTTFTMPTLKIDEELSSLEELPKRIIQHIEDKAWEMFKSVLDDADEFFKKVGKDLATVGDDIGEALNTYYHKSEAEATALLHGVNADCHTVIKALSTGYQKGMNEASKLAHDVEYGADDVGGAVHKVYNAASNDMASALHYAKYGASEIAHSMKHTFPEISPTTVATTLKGLQYGPDVVGTAMVGAFTGMTSSELSTTMLGAKFGGEAVSGVLQSTFKLGSSAANSMAGVVNTVSHTVTHTVTHTVKSVKHWLGL